MHCVRAIEPFCSEGGFIKTYTIVTVPICAYCLFLAESKVLSQSFGQSQEDERKRRSRMFISKVFLDSGSNQSLGTQREMIFYLSLKTLK